MNTYIGVKMVKAKPMSAKDYYAHPDAALGKGDGYFVEYPDGYKSWCPKEEFEKANLKLHGDGDTITEEDVEAFIHNTTTQAIGIKTTLVHVKCSNGFEILESSSCVDPKKYDHNVGKQICQDRIKNQVWGLLGFLLQSARNGFKS